MFSTHSVDHEHACRHPFQPSTQGESYWMGSRDNPGVMVQSLVIGSSPVPLHLALVLTVKQYTLTKTSRCAASTLKRFLPMGLLCNELAKLRVPP
jgi:hypothetical protein